ncbi:YceD family protein [Phenylobacterium terrae]|uniref:YceD family protein n=1 Tax=Phenylobacterium terrae TaxID=2665495 RepID=A0ABW4N583_9CAUL
MSAHTIRLSELARGPVTREIVADEAERKAIAKRLGLLSLPSLRARVTVRPWLDGAEVGGRFEAVVEQECGVTLDAFEQPVAGDIEVRVVPAGSPHAPSAEGPEMELDPDAPDQPDELAGEEVDLGEYLVEHLALEIDPFPRKPGVAFEYQKPEGDDSPFAVLKGLKDRKG